MERVRDVHSLPRESTALRPLPHAAQQQPPPGAVTLHAEMRSGAVADTNSSLDTTRWAYRWTVCHRLTCTPWLTSSFLLAFEFSSLSDPEQRPIPQVVSVVMGSPSLATHLASLPSQRARL